MNFELGKEFLAELRKNPDGLWYLASTSSDEKIESGLDLLLFAFLVNEREFVDSVKKDNEEFMSEEKLKFKYKHFNPETIMGVVFKKNKNKNIITIENSKTDYFKVGTADPSQLEHAKKTLRLSKIQKVNVQKGTEVISSETLIESKYRDLTVVSGTKNSTYLCDKDGNVYFKGLVPHKVDIEPSEVELMPIEEIEQIMSKRPLSGPLTVPMDKPITSSTCLTFHDTFTALCDSISHNNVISKGDFYIFKLNEHKSNSIIASKEWVKAVCETIMNAKSDFDKVEAEKFLSDEFGDSKTISRESLAAALTKLLDGQIEDKMYLENLSNSVSLKHPKEIARTPDFEKKIVEYISLFSSQFKEKTLLSSTRIPSKLYLFLIDYIAECRRNSPEKSKELIKIIKDFDTDYQDIIDQVNASNKRLFNKFQKTKKQSEIMASLTKGVDKWQPKFFESFGPFFSDFLSLPSKLDLIQDASEESKLLLSIAQSIYPLNNFMMNFYFNESKLLKGGFVKNNGFDEEFLARMKPYKAIKDHFRQGHIALKIIHPGKTYDFSNVDELKHSKVLKCIKVTRTAICHNGAYLSFVPGRNLVVAFNAERDRAYIESENNPTLSTILIIDTKSFNEGVDKKLINIFGQTRQFVETKKEKNAPKKQAENSSKEDTGAKNEGSQENNNPDENKPNPKHKKDQK